MIIKEYVLEMKKGTTGTRLDPTVPQIADVFKDNFPIGNFWEINEGLGIIRVGFDESFELAISSKNIEVTK